MKTKTISVIAAAALSIGLGFAATSSATAAPAMGAMQAAQAGIQKSDVTQVRHYRRYFRRFNRPTFGCVNHRHRTQLPNGRFIIFDHQHCFNNGTMAPRR